VGVAALSIKNPDCHGYLQKVGNHRRTWRRRYCVLKYACLYYYIEPSSTTAKGSPHVQVHAHSLPPPGFTVVRGEVTSQSLWSRYDRHFVGIHDIMRWVKWRRFTALFKLNRVLETLNLRKCPYDH